MFSARTGIGIGVGSAIIAIGIASLILHIGIQTIEVDETFATGKSVTYVIPAPEHTAQKMKITGESFDLQLQSPADGLQIPKTTHKNEATLDWVHLADGESRIEIKNIGGSEIYVEGTVHRSTDPLFITYDGMVIVAGIVIIGFSLGFSIRKPRGF